MEEIDINSLNVKEFSKAHKKTFENWTYGEPQQAWYDEEDILCIKYEKGFWWHYRKNKNNILEWW